MGKKIYVGNLNFDMTDAELEETFSQFGEIVSTVVVKDRDSGRSKGFGFIEFAQEADAQQAKEAMNGKELSGRALKVDDAREPRSRDRDRRSGDRGFNRRSRF
jgi:RNA recognition motif-containing protein